jgi:hypothetical protein
MASKREITRLPVRSALFKQRTGGLVVRWVTTSEYPLLYVFAIFFLHPFEYDRDHLEERLTEVRSLWGYSLT